MRALLLLAVGVGCSGPDTTVDAACTPSLLFLNRAGGDYDRGGFDDAPANLSVLVDAPIALPPWPRDDIEWGNLTSCIRAGLSPFPIAITEVDPGAVAHVEIVFTTVYWGQPAQSSMVVPASCRSDHQLEFVFSDSLPPTYSRACQMALFGFAQMTAGLSPGDDCRDIVNLSLDCSPTRSFLDQTVSCVDAANQPVACRCGGSTENTYQAMQAAHRACP